MADQATALVLVHGQVGFIDGGAGFDGVWEGGLVKDRLAALLAGARAANAPVVFLEERSDPESDGPIHPDLAPRAGEVVVPAGSIGFRWGEKGKWNLEEKDGRDGSEVRLRLSLINASDQVVEVAFPYFGGKAQAHPNFSHTDHPEVLERRIPVRL